MSKGERTVWLRTNELVGKRGAGWRGQKVSSEAGKVTPDAPRFNSIAIADIMVNGIEGVTARRVITVKL